LSTVRLFISRADTFKIRENGTVKPERDVVLYVRLI